MKFLRGAVTNLLPTLWVWQSSAIRSTIDAYLCLARMAVSVVRREPRRGRRYSVEATPMTASSPNGDPTRTEKATCSRSLARRLSMVEVRRGDLKEFSGRIAFTEKDRISMDNTFIVTFSISDGSRDVEFFRGNLTGGKFWNDELIPIDTEKGIGKMEYYLQRGGFRMETFNVVARIETSLNNYHIIQKEYHLAIENKN